METSSHDCGQHLLDEQILHFHRAVLAARSLKEILKIKQNLNIPRRIYTKSACMKVTLNIFSAGTKNEH